MMIISSGRGHGGEAFRDLGNSTLAYSNLGLKEREEFSIQMRSEDNRLAVVPKKGVSDC